MHVDPLVVALVVRAAGPARVALVSDAVAPAGAPPGRYPLGGQEVESDGRTVRRADGTIGGSAALLDACLRNVRAWLPWLRAGGAGRDGDRHAGARARPGPQGPGRGRLRRRSLPADGRLAGGRDGRAGEVVHGER